MLRRASRIGVAIPTSSLWRPGGRHPEHPRHRTVREDRRPAEGCSAPGTVAASSGDRGQADRRRTGHRGRAAGLLGFCSEARWLRYAHAHLGQLGPCLPQQRLQQAPATCSGRSSRCWPATRRFGPMTCGWPTPPRWCVAAPRKRSRGRHWPVGPPTATAPANRAGSGGCGCTWSAPSHGLPVAVALAGANADERQVLLGILGADPTLVATRPGPDPHRRQALRRPPVRGGAGRLWGAAAAPRPARASPSGPAPTWSARCGRSSSRSTDLQGPAGSGTPRRPHPGRHGGAGAATHPGPDRRDLAQRPHRPADRQVPARLRSLMTPQNRSSSY